VPDQNAGGIAAKLTFRQQAFGTGKDITVELLRNLLGWSLKLSVIEVSLPRL
jgi:hypothetical protein